jgi:hypothetical protein
MGHNGHLPTLEIWVLRCSVLGLQLEATGQPFWQVETQKRGEERNGVKVRPRFSKSLHENPSVSGPF